MGLPGSSGLCECGCGERTRLAPSTISRLGWKKGEPIRFVNGHYNRTAEARESARRRMIGTKQSAETRAKKRAAFVGTRRGPENPNWKGDAVGYHGLHDWVRQTKTRTERCSRCGRGPMRTEWANVSGEYRRDADDWIELCRGCHSEFDRSRVERIHLDPTWLTRR